MRKRIFILSLGLIILIASFAIISNRNVTKTPKAKYKMAHGYAGAVIAGTTSSANYRLTAGTVVYLVSKNEEVR